MHRQNYQGKYHGGMGLQIAQNINFLISEIQRNIHYDACEFCEELINLLKRIDDKFFDDFPIATLIEKIQSLPYKTQQVNLLLLFFDPNLVVGKRMGAKKGQVISTLSEGLKTLYEYIIAIDEKYALSLAQFVKQNKRLPASTTVSALNTETVAANKESPVKAEVSLEKQIELLLDEVNHDYKQLSYSHNISNLSEVYLQIAAVISNFVSAFKLSGDKKIADELKKLLNKQSDDRYYENIYYSVLKKFDKEIDIGFYLCRMDIHFYRLFSAKTAAAIFADSKCLLMLTFSEEECQQLHAGLMQECAQDFDKAIKTYVSCSGKAGDIAYARLLHIFRNEERDHRIKVQAVLERIDKEVLFSLIKEIQPVEHQISFLLQCLSIRRPTSLLGKRFAIKDWLEFGELSLDKGILAEICDYLIKIDAGYKDIIQNDEMHLSSDYFLQKGLEEWKSDDKKIEFYRKAILIDPKNARAHFAIATTYVRKKMYTQASYYFNKALEHHYDDLEQLYLRRSEMHAMQGHYRAALDDLNQAIALDPSDMRRYFKRGELQEKFKMWDAAIAGYSEALVVNPKYADIYVKRAAIYTKQGCYFEALSDLNQAIALEPLCMRHYFERGQLYITFKKWEEAIAGYSEALEVNPKYADIYVCRAAMYQALARWDEAKQDCEKAGEIGLCSYSLERVKIILGEMKQAQAAVAVNAEVKAALLQEAKKCFKSHFNHWSSKFFQARASHHLLEIALFEEDYKRAWDSWRAALEHYQCAEGWRDSPQESHQYLLQLFEMVQTNESLLIAADPEKIICEMTKSFNDEQSVAYFIQCFNPGIALGKKMGAVEGQTVAMLSPTLSRLYHSIVKLDEGYKMSLSPFVTDVTVNIDQNRLTRGYVGMTTFNKQIPATAERMDPKDEEKRRKKMRMKQEEQYNNIYGL